MRFVHLRCHSSFSLLSGASSVAELVRRAEELGYAELALTDTNGLYAAPEFWKITRSSSVRPIFGVELTAGLDRRKRGARAVALAVDREGFAAACRLATARHLDKKFELGEVFCREAESGKLVILTADSRLLRHLAGRLPEGTLYAELCPGNPLTGSPASLRETACLAEELGLPLAGSANVHFAEPEGYTVHRLLRAVDLGRTLGALEPGESAGPDAWFAPEDEMTRRLHAWPDAVANTAKIAGRCRCELPTGRTIFPSCSLPKGESAYSALLKRSFRGICRRYSPMRGEVLDRLKAELEVIERQGFSPYFLVVADIAAFARKRKIPMIGRGSAANSLVAYALGITDVDPVRYNLFFQRFLNPERSSPPDIDLDFSWRRRDEVLEYVYRTHGADRVAMICTYVTFSTRLAVREVGKAMGLAGSEITRFTRLLPYRAIQAEDPAGLVSQWPECRDLPLEEEPWRTVLRTAKEIAGFPRHISMHAGGIVVSPFPLTELVPLERSAKGLVVTQYDMHGIEDIGLVKIDLLSQRSLSVVEDVVVAVEQSGGLPLELGDIDRLERDPSTTSLIEHGRTMGCFYIESPAMRQLLEKLKVNSFELLTAASSVIRPGVAESGMMAEYIERHRGRRAVEYLDPRLEELLGETYGVMVYQEDVIRVAHVIAGMSLGEADLLRRAMSGKLRSREAMEALERKFVAAAVERHTPPDTAAEIWRQIRSFAGYAFCKAHSASYARISYQVAWLKAHYPAQFMAAVLANGGGFYGPSAYIEEARRLGLAVLGPDINRSGENYTGAGRVVRVGLNVLSGLRKSTLKGIVQERGAGGFFTSLADFCSRVEVSRENARNLVRCGAFDCLELTRPELLWRLEYLFSHGKPLMGGGGGDLFAPDVLDVAGSEQADRQAAVPRLPEYGRRRRLLLERELFGFTVSEHPLALLEEELGRPGLITASRIGEFRGQRVRLIGRPISRKRIRTARHGAMMFLSMDDRTAAFEVVIFPDCYRRVAPLAMSREPLLVTGRVADESGVCTIVCERLEPVEKGRAALVQPPDGPDIGAVFSRFGGAGGR